MGKLCSLVIISMDTDHGDFMQENNPEETEEGRNGQRAKFICVIWLQRSLQEAVGLR